MMELGANKAELEKDPMYKNLKLDDLKSYIKSKNVDENKKRVIDQMNIEDLRNFFESENRR